jgi:hypothetical protein
VERLLNNQLKRAQKEEAMTYFVTLQQNWPTGTQLNSENISHVASIFVDITNIAVHSAKLDVDRDVYKQSFSNFDFIFLLISVTSET